jgi:hypothetical protein
MFSSDGQIPGKAIFFIIELIAALAIVVGVIA